MYMPNWFCVALAAEGNWAGGEVKERKGKGKEWKGRGGKTHLCDFKVGTAHFGWLADATARSGRAGGALRLYPNRVMRLARCSGEQQRQVGAAIWRCERWV
jgi:hypothetical protein